MIGVEVREEVRNGVVAGVPKPIDHEPGIGYELGLRKIDWDWRERRVIGEKGERERRRELVLRE